MGRHVLRVVVNFAELILCTGFRVVSLLSDWSLSVVRVEWRVSCMAVGSLKTLRSRSGLVIVGWHLIIRSPHVWSRPHDRLAVTSQVAACRLGHYLLLGWILNLSGMRRLWVILLLLHRWRCLLELLLLLSWRHHGVAKT